jgi:hypothetical protein
MEDGERAFRCAASWGNIPLAWLALADMYAKIQPLLSLKYLSVDLWNIWCPLTFRLTCQFYFTSFLPFFTFFRLLSLMRLGTATKVSLRRLCCPLLNSFRCVQPPVKLISFAQTLFSSVLRGLRSGVQAGTPSGGPRSFTFLFCPQDWSDVVPLRLQIQRPLFALISKCGMARVREELKALDSVIITCATAYFKMPSNSPALRCTRPSAWRCWTQFVGMCTAMTNKSQGSGQDIFSACCLFAERQR